MQHGLMVEPQMGGTYTDLLSLAQFAEELGFHSFARSDHYLNMDVSAHATDAFATLAGLGRDTSTIELTCLVSPITFRHPAVIAKTAATIHEMSGGRLNLGVGTGWMESEHAAFGMELHPLGLRFDRFEESLGYLWAAFGRSTGGFDGEHFHLDPIDVLPRFEVAIPIVIGGGGMKRTPTLAGRYGDEYNMFVCNAETLDKRLTVMRAAAEEADRDPASILVSQIMNPIIATDETALQERLAANAAHRDVSVDDYTALLDDRDIPYGTPAKIAEAFASFADRGVDRIYLQEFDPLPEIDRDRISQLGELLAAV